MLSSNVSVLTSESAADMRSTAQQYHTANTPNKTSGIYYFTKANDVVGLEASPLYLEGEFVTTDTELTEAQSRQQLNPIYDIRSGAKHVYANSAWGIHATQTLWTDFGIGRIIYNPITSTAYFLAGIGNALPL